MPSSPPDPPEAWPLPGTSFPTIERIRRRRDFLAAARGRSQAVSGAVVQMRMRESGGPPRIGFTVTKKIGNAVMRNRVKRRLREAARLALSPFLRPGHDYVVIGRQTTAMRDFAKLKTDLASAVRRLHGETGERRDDLETK